MTFPMNAFADTIELVLRANAEPIPVRTVRLKFRNGR